VAAGLSTGGGTAFLIAMLVPVAIFAWQIRTLHPHEPANALVRFRANHWVGLALTLALLFEVIV